MGPDPRTEREPHATFESFKARGNFFRALEEELVPQLDSPKLISSLNGEIESIFLTIPGWVFNSDQYPEPDRTLVKKYADAFRGILSQLPQSTNFKILTHQNAEAKLQAWVSELDLNERAEIVLAPNEMKFTVWAEDAYAICNDESDAEKFFVEPASFRRGDDASVNIFRSERRS